MNCKDAEREAERLMQNGLAPPAGELAEHLKACRDCRRDYELLQQLRRALANGAVPEPGEPYWRSFGASVWRRAAIESARWRRPGFTAALVSTAFGTAAVSLLGLYLILMRPAPRQVVGPLVAREKVKLVRVPVEVERVKYVTKVVPRTQVVYRTRVVYVAGEAAEAARAAEEAPKLTTEQAARLAREFRAGAAQLEEQTRNSPLLTGLVSWARGAEARPAERKGG